MYPRTKPMSTRPEYLLHDDDYDTNWEDDNTGGKVKVTRYKDGSSTYHFGGPCGPMNYDANGEEC